MLLASQIVAYSLHLIALQPLLYLHDLRLDLFVYLHKKFVVAEQLVFLELSLPQLCENLLVVNRASLRMVLILTALLFQALLNLLNLLDALL